jgi:hypothetical protein
MGGAAQAVVWHMTCRTILRRVIAPTTAPAPCCTVPAWQPPPLLVDRVAPLPVVDVPEPASALLLAVALVALWWVR